MQVVCYLFRLKWLHYWYLKLMLHEMEMPEESWLDYAPNFWPKNISNYSIQLIVQYFTFTLFQQVSIQFHYWALTTFELDPGKKLPERRWRRLLPPAGSCIKLEFDVTDWARPPDVLAFFSFALIFVYLMYKYMIRISSAQPSAKKVYWFWIHEIR